MCCSSRLVFSWLMGIALAGCGGETVVRDSGTGAGGQGGATAGSSSTGPGSAGGFGPADISVSSSSGGREDCTTLDQGDLRIEVVGDGSAQVLQHGCGEGRIPLLQALGGGECGDGLAARACAAPEGGAVMEVYAPRLLEPGTSDEAVVRYRAGDGVDYEARDGHVVLDELGDVGAIGKGSYSAVVVSKADGATTLSISGGFVLCRVPDAPPCP
ncbi:hypothetical protein [Sorangium sp. So ce131]|uniref:hypothetical protein n=1 Tax=Sorangium sp. So ce131 TaxID=3133282 RepID=UPI003F5E955C